MPRVSAMNCPNCSESMQGGVVRLYRNRPSFLPSLHIGPSVTFRSGEFSLPLLDEQHQASAYFCESCETVVFKRVP